MPYDVFISYSSADLRYAEALHQRLDAEGLKVWFDRARLEPGCDWHAEIEAGCEDSRIVLPVLTPRWKASEWTRYETYGAEAVLPLVFEGDWRDVATPPLERFQADRMACAGGEPADWPRLLRTIARVLAAPAPAKARRIAHLRHLPNPYFAGRDRELVAIHEELHRSPKASLTQGRVRAISGNGGWGKTTLVRHYAEKFWRCYPQMFWVDARLGFEAEFARLHDLLVPEAAREGYTDADKAMRAVAELQGPSCRLLIIDDVDDEPSVARWIPKTGGCHTLITSRFAGWSAAVKSVHLYVLEAEPAIRFLLDRLGRDDGTDAEHAACAALADRLGYLPLALEQAAAYIEQQGEAFGVVDYLRLFDGTRGELLAEGALGSTMYPDSVATTWKPTMARLSPAARAVLRMAAFVAPVPIPMALVVQSPAVARALADAGVPAADGAAAELRLRGILSELKRYSMAAFDGQAFQLHTLLQTVVRANMTPEERAAGWRAATSAIVRAASGHGLQTQLREAWKPLIPHAEALDASHRELQGVDPSTELAEILRDCRYSQGRYDEARPLAELVLAEDEREFGEGDAHCWPDLHALGSIHWRCGRFAEAERWFQKALDLARAIYGDTSPAAAASLGEVALMADKQGDVPRAAALYESALAIRPADAAILGNYAYMRQNVSGDLAGAQALYERALAAVAGDVINLNNYAGLCLTVGDLGVAEQLLHAAWKTAGARKDRFAARTLFVRAALAYLRGEPPGLFLGQLKSIVEAGISPAPSENTALLAFLRARLAPEAAGLLGAVFDAINGRAPFDALNALPAWRDQAARAFEEVWPAGDP
jgi:tetratricopeptide (TPR) repeat protein